MASTDRQWMQIALAEARAAADRGEVPVGAVVTREGREIARAHNRTIADHDPSAHAEVLALRAAARRLRNHRIGGATLYVTLEPCLMCMGAMIQARVERLVFAARDPKAGAAISLYEVGADDRLNHRVIVDEGPLAEEARALLSDFFRARRAAARDQRDRSE